MASVFGRARRFLTVVAVSALVVFGVLYLLADAMYEHIRPPHRIGVVTVLGTLIEMSDQWADIEGSDGTIDRLFIDHLIDTSQTVYAPPPEILPEIGDLVLTTVIDDEPYYLIAGSWIYGDCRHAVRFDYAFDHDGSIVGAALSGLGRDRTGFRIPKAEGFRPEDPPSYSGQWSDYYVVFCINDAGQVVTADLVGSRPRVDAWAQMSDLIG